MPNPTIPTACRIEASAGRTISRLIVAAVVWATAFAAKDAPAEAPVSTVATVIWLQPLGAAQPEAEADVALVQKALVSLYALEVRLLPRQPLPKAAWYPPRRRWRAEKILAHLLADRDRAGRQGFVLGLTSDDISTTKGKYVDWGVLGLGEIGDGAAGMAGVISSFRCHKKASSDEHARQRLAKVAVHELGHTLGLQHCPNRGCLMEDAEGQVVTTDREHDLCATCRAQLAAAGRKLPTTPLPWP